MGIGKEYLYMTVSIVGTIIGLMVLVFGIYYLVKEKEDKESVKIYGVTTAIGAVIFVGMLISLIIKLM